MRGRKQGECSGCGRGKGSHDRNAGWYEMGPRKSGGYHLQHLFCPPCAAALLVGLDERMGEERDFDWNSAGRGGQMTLDVLPPKRGQDLGPKVRWLWLTGVDA